MGQYTRHILASLAIHMLLLAGILGMTYPCRQYHPVLLVDFDIVADMGKTGTPCQDRRQKNKKLKLASRKTSRTSANVPGPTVTQRQPVSVSKSTKFILHQAHKRNAKPFRQVRQAALIPAHKSAHENPKPAETPNPKKPVPAPAQPSQVYSMDMKALNITHPLPETRPAMATGALSQPSTAGENVHPNVGQDASIKQAQYMSEQFDYIRDRIMRILEYPRLARRMGWSGRTKIRFIINNDGSVKDIRIVSSSGHAILDRYAMAAVKKVAPFPKPPGEAEIVIPVTYKLK